MKSQLQGVCDSNNNKTKKFNDTLGRMKDVADILVELMYKLGN